MRAIGGDTDSIFIDFGDKNLFSVMKKSRELEQEINNSFDDFVSNFGIKEHFFSIKLEKVCKSILFVPKNGKGTAKKRYAYIPFWQEGKTSTDIVYSGFAAKRSDNSKLAKNFQKFVIKQILTDKLENIVPLTKMIKFGIENKLFEDNYIGLPGGYNKNIKDYKSLTISVRAAEISNKNFGTNFKKGDRFFWIYTNGKTDVVAFEEKLPEGIEINKKEMVRRNLTGPLTNIYKAINIDYYKHFPKKQIQKNTLKNYVRTCI